MFIFHAKDLKKEISGSVLFENVHLEIKQGEHLAIYGRNGIGKTTLLKGLMERDSFDKGHIQ
ncbi:ABC transporter [Salinibacillus kushneri]|uniref:ABC transporter n=1 Tax=Salinibacillus kushneri TaxID=237682 RepID=A0A1H9Z5C3_9BACI|nr:ATP-binding cassette domain-containing protein [Salinibacillus kushneri]SES76250.1 ABC transporter [Salinibacillus kushneri]